MASGTLYTYPDNFRAAKALIAAKYAKVNVEICPNFVFGETNKSKDFLEKFPSGKVPAFEHGKVFLQDSNAIAYYLSNDKLKGSNAVNKAEIIEWMGFAENEVLPAACAWVFPILGIVKKDAASEEASNRAKEDMKVTLSILDKHLLTRTYLVTQYVTLADIVVACNLLNPFKYAFDFEFLKSFVNVKRWFATLVNQPEFLSVLGEVNLLDKSINQPQQQQQGGGEGKGKKKDKKQEQKQQPKKESKKEKDLDLDATEEALALEPKSKDPFDSLPKGTFNMEDFKRFYSNEDESKSIPYFWEKFDPENYSIWFGEYKFTDELSKVFMSCNLITGMFQRLDKMRKHAFASVCLFGEDNNSTISGIWVWRGQDLAFTLSPDLQIDYESYEWKKLDPLSEETKKLVQQYFSWSGVDKDGRKFNQGKIFK